mmetsp:Transcript_35527/g.77576  ORF Transcript_35527/g.77576 Transcript_35527/m.77576 type:complete len:222 (-) Transcript_35527:162-827(-)|eukprot:CAMPEP_0118935256 /NCGR_PEP_ID=MMETSP1169-20130426/15276_1 /TAXON_ID=36882 /ORGANISM="Pyramimonas obovata, Strain CCMP722" /LENGTH=221 /DNA_ID=CAMNT_0006878265 /DNA_START=236 /DNA_END=901 /DNA_ORIENTATION=+
MWSPHLLSILVLSFTLVVASSGTAQREVGVNTEGIFDHTGAQDEYTTDRTTRHLLASSVSRVSSTRDDDSVKASKVTFSIKPMEGPASGGTQVTISFTRELPKGRTAFRCAFGDKVVPAQSFFASPEEKAEPSLLCQTPAGQPRAATTVRVSFDGGSKFHMGPHFYYHDPIGTISAGPRTMLSDTSEGDLHEISRVTTSNHVGSLMTEESFQARVAGRGER